MVEIAPIGRRIVIVGATGAGKTTLAGHLSSLLDIPHIELDGLFWLPGWQQTPPDEFRIKVQKAIEFEEWVVDGNYTSSRSHCIIWQRADTLIWLDYPLHILWWRLLKRTILRIRSQEDLWDSGNTETWRGQFFSRDSLFVWALKSVSKQRKMYPVYFKLPNFSRLQIHHFQSPNATYHWLNNLTMLIDSIS